AQLGRTKLWSLVQNTPSQARFPGGESLMEVQQRAVAAAQRIAADHAGKVVAVVSHGDTIRLLLSHVAGAHIDLFQRIHVDPGSVSVVSLGDGTPRLLRMNDTGSFEVPRRGRRRVRG